MSYPDNRFYATNNQRGHQLFYDQVLETYPVKIDPNQYAEGVYMADGSMASWGKNCDVKVTDQYNMPTCCSTWADGRESKGNICCPCGSKAVSDMAAVGDAYFPHTMAEVFDILRGPKCRQ